MWADNFWLICDDLETLRILRNELVEHIQKLGWNRSLSRCDGQAPTGWREEEKKDLTLVQRSSRSIIWFLSCTVVPIRGRSLIQL